MKLQNINKEKETIEIKRKEEESWATVTRKLKSEHVIERLEKVEFGMIVKKSEEEKRQKIDFQSEEQGRKVRCGVREGCFGKDGCTPEL